MLALAVGVPTLAACSSRPVGGATVHTVAWVTAGGSVTLPGTAVTPVRLATRHAGTRVPVGRLPSALAYTAGNGGLLVVTRGDDTLREVDPATHTVMRSAAVGVEPDAVAVAPGGTRGKGIALVANLDSNSVTPVDLGTWRALPTVPVGSEPVAIAVYTAAAGAATAFVADFGSNTVTPIDVSTMQAGAAIPVGPGPQAIAVAPGEVLVGNFGNRSLTAVNPALLKAGGTVALPINPTGIAVSPSGTTAYVCGGAGVVSVSTTGLVVGPPVALPDVAQGIALSPGGVDGVGDPAGGLTGPAHAGHRHGGRTDPPRGAPLRHRHRSRLRHRAAGVPRITRATRCRPPGPGSAAGARSAPPCSGRPIRHAGDREDRAPRVGRHAGAPAQRGQRQVAVGQRDVVCRRQRHHLVHQCPPLVAQQRFGQREQGADRASPFLYTVCPNPGRRPCSRSTSLRARGTPSRSATTSIS